MKAVRMALLGSLLASGVLGAQEGQRGILAARLQRELEHVAADAPGIMGIAVVDLANGQQFGVNDTLTFPTASTIKVPLLLTLYLQAERGRLRLDERVPMKATDRTAGSGVLQFLGEGSSLLSLSDLATLMILVSDNTATNILIDRVGLDSVSAFTRSIGLPHIMLRRRMIRPADMVRGAENVATPREAAQLMAKVARCDVPITREHCVDARRLLEIEKTVADDRPPGLPDGVAAAWKAGDLNGGRAGWGIINLPGRPYVFIAMINYGGEDPQSLAAIGRALRASHEYFSRLAGATPYGARVDLKYFPDSANRKP